MTKCIKWLKKKPEDYVYPHFAYITHRKQEQNERIDYVKKHFDTFIHICYNEFINCIKREWNDNPLFDMNILIYEIQSYYKN